MPSPKLPNYLASERKRVAFSQEEVAFLLGSKSGAKVSRYEKSAYVPNLETALALEAIFQRPIRELFAGLYQQAEQEVGERAKALVKEIEAGKHQDASARNLDILAAIINSANKSVSQ